MSEEIQTNSNKERQEILPELIKTASLKSFTPTNSSQIGGVSLRGLLAVFVILTVCYMSIMKTPVVEPLYTLGTVIVSFYFGHQVGQSKKGVENEK